MGLIFAVYGVLPVCSIRVSDKEIRVRWRIFSKRILPLSAVRAVSRVGFSFGERAVHFLVGGWQVILGDGYNLAWFGRRAVRIDLADGKSIIFATPNATQLLAVLESVRASQSRGLP